MSEEAILRKFVADGDGFGEDKRLQTLFLQLRNLNPDALSDSEEIIKIENTLGLVEYSFDKQSLLSDLIFKETDALKHLNTQIFEKIDQLKDQIDVVKDELKEAKAVRKNKQEYDDVARTIIEKPSREETAENLEKLHASLNDLHENQKELELKLNEKRLKVQELNNLLEEFKEKKPDVLMEEVRISSPEEDDDKSDQSDDDLRDRKADKKFKKDNEVTINETKEEEETPEYDIKDDLLEEDLKEENDIEADIKEEDVDVDLKEDEELVDLDIAND
ncbi:unnamed protein product [Bursaphelenchus okinawaensis]|uniref:Uncharacterized protein n=1 Tax=Bursaphelenchus okinawaensis TaxID=465554 RepID=A0A811KSG8_9BILA|nr:unnamed protein product [Bursaphelenchus okinawaensis]CAG9111253.1 unnamed protein product [Bursaphelenchus okinawaensis]